MFTILIADDEERIRRLVSDFLRRDGYTVLQAADGGQAMELIDQKLGSIDLIILDVMMPVYDGWSVLRHIRSKNTEVPVMMLTARTEENDEVFGFDLGADDYITKPFSPIVLSARVRAIEKRCHQRSEGVYQAGELSVNEIRREVCVAGQTVDLTPKEYELLIYFKNNQNIAVSRENILNAVWGYDYFGDLRTVDTHVKKLRAKLGDCGKMIETVRGFGYRFEGEQQ
ncbi:MULTISPECIES: response regulator transcription factor [Butyricicoccus]|jgi:DNA-binding response OmpR family regulator|uniref:Response regulator transcription factor n=1 Tax=Butyricicoccus intestinisimiae TaxID=2841509 RepID=A0ABS6EUS7_9FIRM|nr:response regulator transcription factor [Butyricicoccus intestinisimiae]MBU5491448.1 response regulator transcription factor [Butyricicoccus intestinisimiae]MEE0326720.1 response regulator transcription factor [Butyricicoccus sp.]